MPSLSSPQQQQTFDDTDSGQRCVPLEEPSATAASANEFPDEPSDSTVDPVSRLPFELATACFRLLGFRGRFAVSQVSRAWRRAALADSYLWNSLTTDATRRYGFEMLNLLLGRSGDVPFDFAWVASTAIPDGVLDVLAQNMGRMGRLKYQGPSERLLQHSAPSLRCLTLHDVVVALPADWTHSVPCLEVLELGVFSIPPDFQPLPALKSLSGCLADGSSAPVLARVFPRLVKLYLEGVTQESVRVIGAPPRSCESVMLKSWLGRGAVVDYGPFERACHQLCIPHIVLSGAASISAAAEEFAHATRGECSMLVHGDSSLTLKCKADGVVRVVNSLGSLPFVAEVGGFAHLDRLTELALPLTLLLGIFRRQSPLATFPALRTLQLVLAPEDIALTASIPDHNSEPPLAMPRLTKVVLEVYQLDYARDENAYYRSYNALNRRHVAWLVCDWPYELPAIVTFAEDRLAALTIVMSSRADAEHFVAEGHLESFRKLAETLDVTHRNAFLHAEDSDEYEEDYEDDDFDD